MILWPNPGDRGAFLARWAAGAAAAPSTRRTPREEYIGVPRGHAPAGYALPAPARERARAPPPLRHARVRQLDLTGTSNGRTWTWRWRGDLGSAPATPSSVALPSHHRTTSKPKASLRHATGRSRAPSPATYALSAGDASHCVDASSHFHGLVPSTLATLGSGGCVSDPPAAPRRARFCPYVST